MINTDYFELIEVLAGVKVNVTHALFVDVDFGL
jgi:hypothetical protein